MVIRSPSDSNLPAHPDNLFAPTQSAESRAPY